MSGSCKASCGGCQPQHFGGPLLAARDSICSYPQISQRLMPPQWLFRGCMETRWAFPLPTPLLAPSPRPPSLAVDPVGTGRWVRSGRGPRALKGPLPCIESRQGLPTSSLLGLLTPHGVSQGRTPPSRKTPRTSTPRPPAPPCSWSSQPWCLRTVSGYSPLLFPFLLRLPLLLPLPQGTP